VTAVASVTDALATYRLTKLLQHDDLPPLPKLRHAFYVRYGARPVGQLVDCPWCLSVWIGALVVLARRVCPRVWDPVAATLAASAVTGITAETLDGLKPPEPILRVVTDEKG
jgi:hypothetical protein